MKREHDFQRKLLSTRRETRQFLEFLVTTILMVLTSIMILRWLVFHVRCNKEKVEKNSYMYHGKERGSLL